MFPRPVLNETIEINYEDQNHNPVHANVLIECTEDFTRELLRAKDKDSNAKYHILLLQKAGSTTKRIKEIIGIMEFIKTIKLPHLQFAYINKEKENCYYLFCPYLSAGNLTNFIRETYRMGISVSEPMSLETYRNLEIQILEYIRQLFYALDILHMHNIYLKRFNSDDILLKESSDHDYPCKYLLYISQYSHAYRSDTIIENKKLSYYNLLPPEIKTDYAKVDIYYMGCILYNMLTLGKTPFEGSSIEKIMEYKTIKEAMEIPTFALSTLSLELLEGCLQDYPNNRISLTQIDELIHFRNIYDEFIPIANLRYIENMPNVIYLKSFKKNGMTNNTPLYIQQQMEFSKDQELERLRHENEQLAQMVLSSKEKCKALWKCLNMSDSNENGLTNSTVENEQNN